jgi:hypothetical protein
MDYLACPTCGNPHTDGEFCNLTCRRSAITRETQSSDRFIKKVFMAAQTVAQAQRFMHDLEATRFNPNGVVLQERGHWW